MADDDAHFDDELLSAYLDDELSADERARVEERLAADPAARQLLDELRSVSQVMRSVPHAKLGSDLRDSVLRRAEREMLVAGNGKAAREPEGEPERERLRLPFGRTKRAWFWAGAAIAAALMLMFIEREAPRDAGLPREVALNRSRPQAHDGPLPPLAMRAIKEEENEEKDEVVDQSTLGQPVAAAPAAAAGEASAERGAAEGSGVADEAASSREGFARSSSALARGGGGGFGSPPAARSDRFVEGLGGEELLVVHVSVTPEAMRNRAFDATLLNNSIELEPEPESLADKPATDQEVEVVMVEAAPAQVAATLAEIKEDKKNYVAIEVNEPLVRQQTRELKSKDEPGLADLKQYNRGRVLNQQQVQLSPDNRGYLYFTPPQPSASQQPQLAQSLAKANVAAQEAAPPGVGTGVDNSQLGAQPSSGGRQAPQTLALERDALDASASQAPAAPGVASNRLRQFSGEAWDYAAQNIARRASQKVATKADMLQVLFVLQSEELSSAAATPPGPTPTTVTAPASAEEATGAPAVEAPAVPRLEEGLKDRE